MMNEESSDDLVEEIKRLKDIINEKEKSFSEKRAQFKELYMKKENELKSITDDYNSSINDGLKWKEEADNLKREIEDLRNASLLSDSLRMEELEQMRRKCQNEIEGIEKTMLDNIAAISHREEEMKDKLEKAERDKDIFSKGDNVLTRLAQRVRVNTQEVMKVWKEEGLVQGPCDEDVLRSVVQPYEEDVQILKDKIRSAYNKIDELEEKLRIATNGTTHDSNTLLAIKDIDTINENKLLIQDNQDVLTKSSNLDSYNIETALKKSQSGNDLRCTNDLNPLYVPKSLRRNTDIQSLNEFHSNTYTIDNIRNKSRTVSENEWSRLHLELSALKNKSSGICELCKNYEDQLQALQDKSKVQTNDYNELSEENQANLRLIVSIRESNNKLVCQLNDTAACHEKSITELSDKYNNLNEFCDKLRTAYERFRDCTDRELKRIFTDRRDVKIKMEKIESSYENLLGIRGRRASEMEADKIDLPTDIESAQFNLLRLHEEIIQLKSANEHLNEKLQSHEIFSKEKERADSAEKDAILQEYNNDSKELQIKIDQLTIENNKLKLAQKSSDNLEETLQMIKTELETVKKNYATLENENKSIKKKSSALKQELENSESVQQDFVRLSQTLQIQLEKIRQEEKELRWQFKDDVTDCNECHLDLQGNNSRNKYHCRHCGKVFCKSCLSEIQTGINNRKADVCKVCHTMLVKDAVPYFSINKP